MRKLIYLMNASLDGFVEGPDGRFDWTVPDEEIHRFHGGIAQDMGAFLYGRRLYETMAVWQTFGDDPALPEYVREFGQMWKSKPKIVFSSTLESVGPGCRLVKGDAAREVARLKEEKGADLAVGGPTLASSLARLGLIDEFRVVIFPFIVGGGKPYLSAPGVSLRLLEMRRFERGAVYLRYARA